MNVDWGYRSMSFCYLRNVRERKTFAMFSWVLRSINKFLEIIFSTLSCLLWRFICESFLLLFVLEFYELFRRRQRSDSEITAHDILQKDSFLEFLLLSLNVVKHRAWSNLLPRKVYEQISDKTKYFVESSKVHVLIDYWNFRESENGLNFIPKNLFSTASCRLTLSCFQCSNAANQLLVPTNLVHVRLILNNPPDCIHLIASAAMHVLILAWMRSASSILRWWNGIRR